MQERFMREALDLARQAALLGEVPVGAVVVKKSTGEVVGRGSNRRETARSPLAHAELEAIAQASERLGGWRLIDCELYVTLEPCAMCSGAIINSRIERVVFGAYDKRFGACGSVITLFDLPFNHRPELIGGVLEEECAGIMSGFFKELRMKKSRSPQNKLDNIE